jgi:hypothetical protein
MKPLPIAGACSQARDVIAIQSAGRSGTAFDTDEHLFEMK